MDSKTDHPPSEFDGEIAVLEAMTDDEIDTSDIPETADWRNAEVGKFYRPIKKSVTIRIDADVLDWFKSQDGRYQTKINQVLRNYVEQQ